ncbi:MAG: hypothetical protein ACOX8S_09630 [Christensenellales bacterium]
MDRSNIEFIQQWFAENESFSLSFNLDGHTKRWYVVAQGDSGSAGFSTKTLGLTFGDIEAAREFVRQAPLNDQLYFARLLSRPSP